MRTFFGSMRCFFCRDRMGNQNPWWRLLWSRCLFTHRGLNQHDCSLQAFNLEGNIHILIQIIMSIIPQGPMDDKWALVKVMVICRKGNEQLLKPGSLINTLRPRQNCRHFADNIFKWIFLNENVWISLYGPCMIVPHKWTKIYWLATAN